MATTGIQRPTSASGSYQFHPGFLPSPAVSPSYSRPSSAASQHDSYNGYRKAGTAHSFTGVNQVNHRPAAARHTTSTQHLSQKVQRDHRETALQPETTTKSPAKLITTGTRPTLTTTGSSASSKTQIEPAPPADEPDPEKWEVDLHQPPPFTASERYSEDRPRSPPPMRAGTPAPITFDREKPTLKYRLRRALSFSSSSNLAELAGAEGAVAKRSLFKAGFNRSNDNLSVTSTSSSASVMLRKMSQNLSRRTRQTLTGIFSGSGRRRADTPDPFSARPVNANISYVHAESLDADRSRPLPDELARQMSPEHTGIRALPQTKTVTPTRRRLRRNVPVTSAQDNVDGHGSIEFPRLSQEIVDEDLPRRGSMHLDRAMPVEALQSQQSLVHSRNDSHVSTHHVPDNRPLLPPVTTKKPARGILKKKPMATVPTLQPPKATVAQPSAIKIDFEQELLAMSAPLLALNFDLESTTTNEPPPVSNPAGESSTPTLVAAESRPTSPFNKRLNRLQFSPRIAVHDTYHANEYDRRGDIATCNRLTPLLAQRIKEELNSFKMDEMAVAEDSRIYTHFFT